MLTRFSEPRDVVGMVDALLLSGGEDVHPSLYCGRVDEHSTAHDPERDAFEIGLVSAALEAQIPILGVCRGSQLLNVALGGSLTAHVPMSGTFSHHDTPELPHVRRHSVQLVEPSLLNTIYSEVADDTRGIRVNSFHHQAVEVPGRGLRIAAVAFDGTIEAIELEGAPVVGVQWHPEWHEGCDMVISWLVETASTKKAGCTQ